MVRVEKQIFFGKQNIPWKEVERYMKRYIGEKYVVQKYNDEIIIPSNFPNEYIASKYSQSLKGGLAKTKANVSQVIGELIRSAINRRFVENKEEKHKKDASKGWYRYDVFFEVSVKGNSDDEIRWNRYRGTLIVRLNEKGMYLHDLINIKKEARTPLES